MCYKNKIYIYDKEFLIKHIRTYSKDIRKIITLENEKVNYKKLMEYIASINLKNSYTSKIRILKKVDSILNEDLVLDIRLMRANKENIKVIYLRKT